MMKHINLKRTATVMVMLAATALAGCAGTYGRPKETSIADSINQMSQQRVPTVAMMPTPVKPNDGALWQPGAKQFFRDSRASNVGDIVTVSVDESASAQFDATTSTSGAHAGNAALPGLLNLTSALTHRGIDLNNLVNTASSHSYDGSGKTGRNDSLTADIAAVVTQKLPNGYLVIQGKREVLVNYEKQVLTIQGIIRPEDINADNTISSEKVAEARITLDGNGTVDDVQQPPIAAKFVDKWMPF